VSINGKDISNPFPQLAELYVVMNLLADDFVNAALSMLHQFHKKISKIRPYPGIALHYTNTNPTLTHGANPG